MSWDFLLEHSLHSLGIGRHCSCAADLLAALLFPHRRLAVRASHFEIRKPAYRRDGKAVTYGIPGSQVLFRSIPEDLCDTVAAMWCLLDSTAKSIFVQ